MQRFSQLHAYVTLIGMGGWLLVAASPAARAQIGLGLSPMRVELTLSPGVPHTDSLELTNETAAQAHVKGELLDFFIDANEDPQFGVYAGEEHSCRQFLRVSATDIDLKPNQRQTIRYTARPPADLKPGSYHCALGLTTQAIPSAAGSGLSMNVRMIASFYVTIGTPQYKVEVKEIALEERRPSPGAAQRAYCILTNPGKFAWRPNGSLDVVEADGTVREHVALRSIPVLPGHDQKFLVSLAASPRQGDVLRLRMEVGNGEIEEARVDVSQQMLSRR